MHQDEMAALFDKSAATYDRQWERMAPLRDCLHMLMEAVFTELPDNARVLCVGAGTGAELVQLAQAFPGWTFTAVDPSEAMLAICKQRTEELGLSERCAFHAGYIDTLETPASFDAATAILVSQFLLDKVARTRFFQNIADRLVPGGILVSADLSAKLSSPSGAALMEVWLRVMKAGGLDEEALNRMRDAYSRDVAVAPAEDIEGIITAGGFESPVEFFQAGMIHSWYSTKVNRPQKPLATV